MTDYFTIHHGYIDAMDSESLWGAVSDKGCHLRNLEQWLQEMTAHILQLAAALTHVTTQLAMPSALSGPVAPGQSLVIQPNMFGREAHTVLAFPPPMPAILCCSRNMYLTNPRLRSSLAFSAARHSAGPLRSGRKVAHPIII